MYKKLCNRCYHSSYSSCNVGKWFCPTCSQDLTNMKAIVASNQITVNLKHNYQKITDLRMNTNQNISYKI
ncbi:hypothetical protein [Metabacillus halosaccharovorans]|uniref:hypothetical protein n=1 Tax=Metabacillus halosaccharovorans TaxID=930124 RepID=UPI0011169308|nr:hypothetical protein [Metabacillus halosaccharovorans]